LKCLTIVLSALNEEDKIALTVNEILPVARSIFDAFEIFLFNDGSKDRTGEVMEELAQKNPEIKVIHHAEPMGTGVNFKEALELTRFDYITGFPGDHAYNINGLEKMFKAIGDVDFVICYRTNQIQTRPFFRIILSWLFHYFIVILFRYNLKDFHGVAVYPVQILRKINITSDSFLAQTEVFIKLLKQRVSYTQIPVTLNPDDAGSSQSLRWSVFQDLIRTLLHLYKSN